MIDDKGEHETIDDALANYKIERHPKVMKKLWR